MKRVLTSLSVLCLPLVFAAAACETPPAAMPPPPPPPVPSGIVDPAPVGRVVEGASGVDPAAIDKSISPCDDFFSYACSGWVKAHPIPADETVELFAFMEAAEESKRQKGAPVKLETVLAKARKK